jgi:hypothetical protein
MNTDLTASRPRLAPYARTLCLLATLCYSPKTSRASSPSSIPEWLPLQMQTLLHRNNRMLAHDYKFSLNLKCSHQKD